MSPILYPPIASPLHLLHRAEQCIGAAFDNEMRKLELDVTVRQVLILRAIEARAGSTQTALVTLTGIDRSTLSDVLTRLARRGLVQRRRMGRDKRAHSVNLSDKGRDILARAKPGVDKVEALLLARLPVANRKSFVDALSNIVQALAASPHNYAGE